MDENLDFNESGLMQMSDIFSIICICLMFRGRLRKGNNNNSSSSLQLLIRLLKLKGAGLICMKSQNDFTQMLIKSLSLVCVLKLHRHPNVVFRPTVWSESRRWTTDTSKDHNVFYNCTWWWRSVEEMTVGHCFYWMAAHFNANVLPFFSVSNVQIVQV